MYIERKEREELKSLSKEIFGTLNGYRRLLSYQEVVTRKSLVTVPGENGAPDTTKEVNEPVLLNGIKQVRTVNRTAEEVKNMMLDFKKQLQDLKEKQEKEAQKQQISELNEELKGSSVL